MLAAKLIRCLNVKLNIESGAAEGWNVSNGEYNFFCLQEVKKAILSDMTKLGKEAGLKSFEQVTTPC